MCDTADNSPYLCFKGEHLNLIQINLQSESSTGDSVQSACENSEVKRGKTKKKVGKKNTKKLNNTGKYENCLRKKQSGGKPRPKSAKLKIIKIK